MRRTQNGFGAENIPRDTEEEDKGEERDTTSKKGYNGAV